jgi:CRISPR-associated protein Csh1
MIEALKTIGEYAKEKSTDSLLTQLVDNPNSNGQYEKVLLIVFKYEEGEIKYQGVEVEEFTKSKLDKYAYKKGSSRGGDLTPTSKITELNKTFPNLQRPIKKLCDILNGDTKNEKIILKIYEILNTKETSEKIFQELINVYEKLDGNAILTIAVYDNNKKLYVGDFEEFTSFLLDGYEKKFYQKSSYTKTENEAVGYNNICYICSRKSSKTYGFVGTYSFYTLDKPGFTSGGFNRGEAWKNYPVCPECARTLDLGKDYLEEYLSARFCGINYLIIPKTIFTTEGENRQEIFNVLEYLEEHRKMSLSEETKDRLSDTEDELFALMKDFSNFINFNLVFYEEQKSAFRILLYIEDVLPSYIKQIFTVKKTIDDEDIFKDLTGKDGEKFSMYFSFKLISDFFYVNQTNKPDFTKHFLEITNGIFKGKKLSYYQLIERFVSHLQEKFRNGESTWYDNLKALMILKFLDKLNLIPDMRKGEYKLSINSQNEYQKKIEDFLSVHSDILNSNPKILAFLEGVLAQKLLNIQKSETDGATPFMSRLNGLKINKKILMRIYSEAINKLEEYNKNYYEQLEKMIADYVLISDLDDLSNDELSFYFVTGMNQAGKFTFDKKEKEDETNGSD